MLVTHIIPSLEIGGAEKTLIKLIKNDKKNTHIIICLLREGSMSYQAKTIGAMVYSLGLKNFLNLPVSIFKAINIIKSSKPDVLVTWMYHSDLIGGIIGFILRIKVIWNIRNTDAISARGKFNKTYLLMKICAALSYLLPHKIICVAKAAKNQHISYGYDGDKILVIPNGYEFDDIQEIKQESIRSIYHIPIENNLIGSVGRFSRFKDHQNLINTAEIMLQENTKLSFMLVGENINEDNHELTSMIEKTGYRNNFILIGEVESLKPYFNAFDIFCLHSKSEGFPNVLVEAIIYNCLCVTTDCGDAAEIMNDNRFVAEISNPLDLASKLKYALNLKSDEIYNIKFKLRSKIQSSFNMESFIKRYNDVYESVK